MVSLEEKWKDKKIYDSAFYGVKVKIASWSFVCECVCFCLCVSVCVLGSKEKSISCLIDLLMSWLPIAVVIIPDVQMNCLGCFTVSRDVALLAGHYVASPGNTGL